MASIRQYIGARYVFKVYENSTDSSSAEWEENTTYEPLTIVTYKNSSYASKKDVPATVGNPAENGDYWVVTGAYNGQIASLQSAVETLNESVNTINTNIGDLSALDTTAQDTLVNAINEVLSNISSIKPDHSLAGRTFILIGDSYGRGYDGTAQAYTYRGWTYINKELLEAAGATVYLLSASSNVSGGFTTTNTWLTSLQQLLTDESLSSDDCESVTDIVILGGTNDVASNGATYSSIKSAMNTFFTYARSTFPNAHIKLGILSAVLTVVCNNSAQTWKAYSECIQYGVEFLTDGALLLNNGTYMGTDNTHLTEAGYEALCPKLFDLIVSGHCEYAYTYNVDASSYLGSDITNPYAGTADVALRVYYNQNSVTIMATTTDACGTPFTISNVSGSSTNYTMFSGVPRWIPFTRQYIIQALGDGFIIDSSYNTQYNTRVALYCSAAADNVNQSTSTITLFVGRPLFSRSGSTLLFNLQSSSQPLFERY